MFRWGLRHERLAYFPMVTGWVFDAAHTPPISFADRCDFSCSGRNRLCKHSIRVINGQDHPDGQSAAQGVRTRVCVLLHPEGRSTDRELSDHHAALFVFKAFHLNCAERCLVVVDSLSRMSYG